MADFRRPYPGEETEQHYSSLAYNASANETITTSAKAVIDLCACEDQVSLISRDTLK